MEKKDFSEMFDEFYTKYNSELEILRKKALFKIILIIVAPIVGLYVLIFPLGLMFIYENIFSLVVFGLVVMISFAISKISNEYARTFKMSVIEKLIVSKNHDYIYIPESGVTATEYNASGYDKTWDRFYSEDGIVGTFNSMIKFTMSQVMTEENTRDSKGKRQVRTTFSGLYGIITLPDSVGGNIDIVEKSTLRKFSKYRINLNSTEFEKYYDVIADNKILALKVINSKSIKDLIDLRIYFKETISIRIIGNKIFFKLSCGDVFEPSTLRGNIRFDSLYKYYRLIDLPRYIYDALISNIADADGNKELK